MVGVEFVSTFCWDFFCVCIEVPHLLKILRYLMLKHPLKTFEGQNLLASFSSFSLIYFYGYCTMKQQHLVLKTLDSFSYDTLYVILDLDFCKRKGESCRSFSVQISVYSITMPQPKDPQLTCPNMTILCHPLVHFFAHKLLETTHGSFCLNVPDYS